MIITSEIGLLDLMRMEFSLLRGLLKLIKVDNYQEEGQEGPHTQPEELHNQVPHLQTKMNNPLPTL